MLKIAVFCGGTGSIALQKGFSALYGIDNIQMDIVVNAYDNGKSTGVCRRVFHNQILGPSDVRKNQLLHYSIRYGDKMRDKTSRESRLYQLFSVRLSAPDPVSYYKTAREELRLCKDILDGDTWEYLNELLDFFFFEYHESGEKTVRRTTYGEKFDDFALSNIFYAACAVKRGNSLEAAMDYMAGVLGLSDTVHMISDKPLLLKAETESGHIIEDEGDIVEWDNPDDKIIRAILMDGDSEYIPSVNEGSAREEHSVSRIVEEADIIIFSSGTQWSSLIPTYMHRGFRQMIRRSSAKKYLIMNNVEDHDVLGVDAAGLCKVLEQYLDMDELTVVVNEYAVESMSSVPPVYKSVREKLGEYGAKTHIPESLVKAIMADYYKDALACGKQFFDLDGTLWNETGTETEKEIGAANLALFDGTIISGNAVEHIQSVWEKNAPAGKNTEVFADYGNTYFHTDEPDKLSFLTDRYFLPEGLADMIRGMAAFQGKSVKTRGGVVLTIKPLENREELAAELNRVLETYDNRLNAHIAGKTSVDILHRDYTKAVMVGLIFEKCGVRADEVVFIGNELKHGSEKGIAELGITTLQVDDVFECYVYLKTRALVEGPGAV